MASPPCWPVLGIQCNLLNNMSEFLRKDYFLHLYLSPPHISGNPVKVADGFFQMFALTIAESSFQ